MGRKALTKDKAFENKRYQKLFDFIILNNLQHKDPKNLQLKHLSYVFSRKTQLKDIHRDIASWEKTLKGNPDKKIDFLNTKLMKPEEKKLYNFFDCPEEYKALNKNGYIDPFGEKSILSPLYFNLMYKFYDTVIFDSDPKKTIQNFKTYFFPSYKALQNALEHLEKIGLIKRKKVKGKDPYYFVTEQCYLERQKRHFKAVVDLFFKQYCDEGNYQSNANANILIDSFRAAFSLVENPQWKEATEKKDKEKIKKLLDHYFSSSRP